VLREHRKHQLEERLAFGSAYQDADLVFAIVDGTPIHPDRFSDHFDILVRKSGLPRIRLHDLRHGWASIALRAGVHPKALQERIDASVIGAGGTGSDVTYALAGAGLRVVMAERDVLGGECANFGCDPTKAMLRAARVAATARRAAEFGVRVPGPVEVDFPEVM